MAQIVEADAPHAVLLQEGREGRGQPVGLHPFSQLVQVDVVQIVLAVAFAAEPLVLRLLLFQLPQELLEALHQGQGPMGGLGLGAVLLDDGVLPVDVGLRHRVPDGDGLFLEVDGVPFEPQHLLSAQTVEGRQLDAQLQQISLHRLEELGQLLGVIGDHLVAVFPGPLDFVGGVAVDQVRFEGVLQSLADVGVAVDHRVGAALPLLQLVTVVLLNVPGGQILEQQLGVALLEVGNDLLLNAVLIGGIGGGLHLVFPSVVLFAL